MTEDDWHSGGMESMKELGERIKTERVAQGYSVKSAAEKSGLARDTWRKIEAGASVQDTKRHIAMQFLGIGESNTEWGTIGRLEDHAADPTGFMDLNLMFSQAVRFTATLGILVPEVREEAERVSVALSDLFARGYQLWDHGDPLDKYDTDKVDLILPSDTKGGDGNADARAGGPSSTNQDDYELIAHDEEHTIESEQGHDETP